MKHVHISQVFVGIVIIFHEDTKFVEILFDQVLDKPWLINVHSTHTNNTCTTDDFPPNTAVDG